jgi:uncharacterized membrane protein
MSRKILLALLIVLSIIGIADSVYLAGSAATDTPLVCDINGLGGCNEVAQSPYSKVFGIPLADFGLAFYSILLVLTVLYSRKDGEGLTNSLKAISIIGALLSIYFVFVQFFVIKALCVYCLVSALVSWIFLGIVLHLTRSTKSKDPVVA